MGYEEIEMDVPTTGLSMAATVAEEESEDVEKLFAGISEVEVETPSEDLEELRLENLKRKYQNAIGTLPYGIPSHELEDWDWVELAAALATGEKKTLPDGLEATEIDGRWYYSDPDDTGTFLKEHGAKPKEEPKPKPKEEPSADNAKLMAKLEERFIMGEISEETYERLRKKYEG
jgi:hypothetical protein